MNVKRIDAVSCTIPSLCIMTSMCERALLPYTETLLLLLLLLSSFLSKEKEKYRREKEKERGGVREEAVSQNKEHTAMFEWARIFCGKTKDFYDYDGNDIFQ